MEFTCSVRIECTNQRTGTIAKQQSSRGTLVEFVRNCGKPQIILHLKPRKVLIVQTTDRDHAPCGTFITNHQVSIPLQTPAAVFPNNIHQGKLTLKLGDVSAQSIGAYGKGSVVQLLMSEANTEELSAFADKVAAALGGKLPRKPLQPVNSNLQQVGGAKRSPGKMGPRGLTGNAAKAARSAVEDLPPLSKQQENAMKIIKAGHSIFMTGSAGTGKSLLLRHILHELPASSTFFTASTGLAACQLGGTTLHSFAGIGRGEEPMERLVQRASRPEARRRWIACQVLIVDEISMVDGAAFDTLEEVARQVRGIQKPFGGIQLVCVGDFHQLPPVSKARKFCFQSPAWAQCISKCVEFSRVFRQVDNLFVELLEAIRQGKATIQQMSLLMDRCRDDLDTEDGILPTKLLTHRADCDGQNNTQLDELPGEKVAYIAVDEGIGHLLDHLRNNCSARSRLELKIGAQVMLIQTISARRGLVNGARGVVTEFRGLQKLPVVMFSNGEEMMIGREKWSLANAVGRASRKQVPLALAWAVSVHKSQGMTLDKVEVNLDRAFEYGMAYVALSRVRGMEGLCIKGSIAPKALEADPLVLDFYDKLRSMGKSPTR